MKIVASQSDSILNITSDFWEHASTRKYPNIRSVALRRTSFFDLVKSVNVFEYEIHKERNTSVKNIANSNSDPSLRAAVSNYVPEL